MLPRCGGRPALSFNHKTLPVIKTTQFMTWNTEITMPVVERLHGLQYLLSRYHQNDRRFRAGDRRREGRSGVFRVASSSLDKLLVGSVTEIHASI